MPIGYLVNVAVMAILTLVALAPPRPSHSSPFRISFALAYLVNELPFLAFYCLVASTAVALGEGDIRTPGGRAALGLAVLTTIGLTVVAWRGLRARPAVAGALREGLGTGWRADLDADVAGRLRRRLPWVRILFVPFLSFRRDVERVANISYGNAGRRNLLDVYRHRSHPAGCPTLIYLHGGAFRIGSKIRGARPLIYRLASQGWLCISANYRLGGASMFPDHLIDTKKVIAWVREHGHDYGADPTTVFLAGSSAGAHLASTAALTPNDPAFQPGFEGADTSVTAAISLGGYYGPISPGQPASSPLAHVRSDAPPFFVVHGDRDTVVIADDARHFVERLQSTSAQAVVYAELPWGQHGFDFFHSVRFDAVVDAIDAFTGWVRSRARQSTPGAQLPSAAE